MISANVTGREAHTRRRMRCVRADLRWVTGIWFRTIRIGEVCRGDDALMVMPAQIMAASFARRRSTQGAGYCRRHGIYGLCGEAESKRRRSTHAIGAAAGGARRMRRRWALGIGTSDRGASMWILAAATICADHEFSALIQPAVARPHEKCTALVPERTAIASLCRILTVSPRCQRLSDDDAEIVISARS